MGGLNDGLKLLRFGNGLIAFAAVWVGYLCYPNGLSELQVFAGSLSLMLLALAGNVENDIFDIDIDKFAHPDRPLPKGTVTKYQARWMSVLLYLMGNIAGLFTSSTHFMFSLAITLLLLVYNRKFKKMPFIGNFTVALLCGAAPWLPEFPALPTHSLVPIVFAFVTTLAREIVKDMEDMPGDMKLAHKTLPIATSIPFAKKLALLLIIFVIGCIPIPVIHFAYHWSFLTLVTIFSVIPLLKSFLHLYSAVPSDESFTLTCRKSQKLIKIAMLGGMIAIVSGLWFR